MVQKVLVRCMFAEDPVFVLSLCLVVADKKGRISKPVYNWTVAICSHGFQPSSTTVARLDSDNS